MNNWAERRQASRTPCSLAVRLREPDGKLRLNWLFDISTTGAGALVFVPLDGTKVYGEIVTRTEGRPLPFEAELVWARYDQTPAKIGLRFCNVTADLLSWLSVLFA